MFGSGDIGIDLGTSSILIYVGGKGIVLREPSVIAMAAESKDVKAVGAEAYRMLGRTPGNIVAVRPMKDGVIADYSLTERMLTLFLRKTLSPMARFFKPQVMVGVPSGVTDVERRAVVQALVEAGARRAFLIEEPLAAAIGSGIDIAQPIGTMVVDIGGGSTDIAVLSLGGIVVSESLRIAGNAFDEAVVRYVRKNFNLLIGERTAEEIKIKIGAAKPVDEEERISAEIRGRDLVTGLPRTVEINTNHVVEALSEPIEQVVLAVRRILESAPPELVSDIVTRGILLTGGGGLFRHFDQVIEEATGVPVVISENALEAVAIGTGRALEMIPVLKDTLVSSDRVMRH
jgi:rod shape-determining protein MreB